MKKITKKREFPMKGTGLDQPDVQETLSAPKKPVREDNQLLFMALCREFLTDQEMREAAAEGLQLHEAAMKKLEIAP